MEQVSPDLLRLMHGWPYTPAFVCNRWMDVLARNPLAAALYDGLEHADNLLRLVFLDPAAREFYRDWETDRPRQGGPPARRRGSGPRRSRT